MQRIQDMFINMEEVAEDAYKNTELLLSQYTKVMFRIEKNLVDIDYEMYAEEGKHLKLSKGESLDSDMNVQEPVNVIYQTIISVKSLCFSSIVISTDALAYIILEHEEKNTMTFLSD